MATATDTPERGSEVALVDPRAPRFGQTITATGLLAGIVLQLPAFVLAVAVLLVVPVLSGWRIDPYGLLWRRLVGPALEPEEPEPAAPHRFARLLGAVGTTLASVLILADVPLAGYAVAGAVALAAGLAAVTGICLGCRMYRGVSIFRRLDVV